MDGDDESYQDADDDPPAGGPSAVLEGTDLILFNTVTKKRTRFPFIVDYFFDKAGKSLVSLKAAGKKGFSCQAISFVV